MTLCWLLRLLQRYVPNQGDAWTWALDYLRRTIDELAVLTETVPAGEGDEAPIVISETRTDIDEALAGYLAQIGAIGTRLGELHAVLAQPAEDPHFGTRAADADDVRVWTARVREQVTRALDHLEAWQETHADISHTDTDWLQAQRDALPAVKHTGATGAFAFRQVTARGKPAGYDAVQTPIVSVTKNGKYTIEK